MCSLGLVEIPAGATDYEEVTFIDKAKQSNSPIYFAQENIVVKKKNIDNGYLNIIANAKNNKTDEYQTDLKGLYQIKNIIIDKLKFVRFEIEKIENNIIYSYNPTLLKKFKKIALISTFCDTPEKIKILSTNIKKIKSLGVDVMAISPSFISLPEEITSECDYFFYTKDNPLLGWPERMYTHWYEMPIDGTKKITSLHRGQIGRAHV